VTRIDPQPGVTPSGDATDAGNAAPTGEVRAMFDRIARVYDPMNLVISAFQEPYWRRRLVRGARLRPGGSAIDVASGTGKVAADLHRSVRPGGRVLGVDISPGMIEVARRRFADREGLGFVVGDALALPDREDGTFDAATIAFGMRNLPDYRRGFEEMARSVRRGPRAVPRDRPPRSRLARSYAGGSTGSAAHQRIAGQGDAYAYLVRSVRLPAARADRRDVREAGLVDVTWRGLTGSIVTLHAGTIPER
jgi:demethylmenaquinone methyltransferase/2-methoxy-6-polyprenyl-1,4-benzoquinol methylase